MEAMEGEAAENPVDLTRVSPEEDSPLTLVVSTWNISCSPSTEVVSYEADPSWSRKDNENCIARTIIETFSDVLILQEAPEKLDQMLSARIWRMEHQGEPLRTSSHCPYLWVLIKRRVPCEIVKVERMDGAILVLLDFGHCFVEIAGVHFMAGHESFQMRQLQMTKVLNAHSTIARCLIVGGDMNVRQKEIPRLASHSKLKLEEALLPKGAYTWNGFRNKYHGPDAFCFRCNFDRIFIATDGVDEKIELETVLFGNKPMEHGNCKFFLSDHFGLRCIIRLKGEQA